MSVAVREKATGRCFVFAKGAESSIMNKLAAESYTCNLKLKVEEEVLNFGRKGLRTLVFAMRELSLSQVNSVDWSSNDKEELASACVQQLLLSG